MRQRRTATEWTTIIGLTIMAICSAGPAEAVCGSVPLAGSTIGEISGALGLAGLRVGAAAGKHIGMAVSGTAIAGTWPVGLTVGSLVAAGTAVVLLASPAACLALGANPGTLPIVAVAAGVTVAGALILYLMTQEELDTGGILEHVYQVAAEAVSWVWERLPGTTTVRAAERMPEQPAGFQVHEFVGPVEIAGPVPVMPVWTKRYEPGFESLKEHPMFPGVPGT